MGCIADSINTVLSTTSYEHQTFLSHYLSRKSFFQAAIYGEIAEYQAYQMSENLRNELNSSLASRDKLFRNKQRCISRCLINNKSGAGTSGIMGGLGYCNRLCN